MASHWRKSEVCGVDNCRSRLYTLDENDGYQYCENGHRRGNALVIGEDEDQFNPHAKRLRKKSSGETEKVYQYFKGREAFDLYLQCYQLILRHQIWFMVHSKCLPAELENVIFDLWALRISTLKDRIDDTSGDESQSQMFSSASEGEIDDGGEAPRLGRRGRRVNDTPKLIDTLALCYLGTLTLRLPVTPGDLHEWVTDGDMAYTRAIKYIPVPMKERLPSAYHSSLDPNSILKLEHLHAAVLDLIVAYQRDYSAEFPALNHPLLLYRYMKRLALPLEVYPAVTRLARLLDYAFTYPLELAKKRARIIDIPGAQLISLVVVSVKLFYPFDDVRRYPSTATEPAVAVIDWDAWKDATTKFRRALEVPDKMKPKELMAVKEKDVFSMSDSQMDQYLDWYQRTWTDESVREQDKDSDFRTALFREFPVGPDDEQKSTNAIVIDEETIREAETERLRAVHSTLKVRAVVTEEEAQEQGNIKRPGSLYKYYRKESDLPDNARVFYEEAAKISGLSMKMLIKAVFLTEMKIQRRGDMQRKEKRQREEL
ncbi:hypothetical protein AOQ84DRAFT_432871 [Glonium stellatum]|uniref:RRN7-type domain-containing protein n=1 Tax=Glonium stellatum TaxID=574774 RepID=A0A8E2JQG9_9PEZI|nr:hypothetical protein AOQ84DRAFT_432871 [Glonium stellatum]